ncbi:GNAT family N-acetyltransferase [Streptacidiphilus sp. N1-10]|uniref:GNAT family N-acetyltransferase n=1 Tax=Streptacidiphilus jeojiensis TaxID=3229225 RepID=A0ABV6XW09_9ACTN
MAWEITHDVDAFHSAAAAYLAADPVRNTVLLTVADTVRSRGPHAYGGDLPARFGWWRGQDSTVQGAYVHTPPFRPTLGPMPDEAARALVRKWRSSGATAPGVSGGVGLVRTVGEEWAATGGGWTVFRDQRLFRLGELTPPQPESPGSARLADAADVPLVVRWFEEFSESIGEGSGNIPTQAQRRVAAGNLVLWVLDGAPVSMAGFSRVIAGQGRVAPVYTPSELRGRGYAGMATVAASRALRAAGAAEVLLYTDLANPTSNALYQRLGYRPVEDVTVLDLHD